MSNARFRDWVKQESLPHKSFLVLFLFVFCSSALASFQPRDYRMVFAIQQKDTHEECPLEGYSSLTKIFRFATGEPAHRWLSLKCEPSHLTVQSSILTDCTKNKRTPTRSVLLLFGAEGGIRTLVWCYPQTDFESVR